eukprot:CAMPEP_0116822506 /NCGR_PEP_ID=MMETSP0418-20121206/308_1 /TAXON_ID=1158023 /ORGANISM="Astrosyne radiata, Strain 13vi08-1A" /LENGTH=89 /DNA_ID=CAMNT_0004450631 /DNA_START=457 /DNA_END=729 /DNA_ORIENTATION=-
MMQIQDLSWAYPYRFVGRHTLQWQCSISGNAYDGRVRFFLGGAWCGDDGRGLLVGQNTKTLPATTHVARVYDTCPAGVPVSSCIANPHL